MTIQLPKDVERSINAEVSRGHFASPDEALAEAWRVFLQQRIPEQPSKKMTLDDVHRQMLADGILPQLPIDEETDDKDDSPIEIEGGSLSRSIIRDRR